MAASKGRSLSLGGLAAAGFLVLGLALGLFPGFPPLFASGVNPPAPPSAGQTTLCAVQFSESGTWLNPGLTQNVQIIDQEIPNTCGASQSSVPQFSDLTGGTTLSATVTPCSTCQGAAGYVPPPSSFSSQSCALFTNLASALGPSQPFNTSCIMWLPKGGYLATFTTPAPIGSGGQSQLTYGLTVA